MKYERLCREVERVLGREVITKGDFVWLSDALFDSIGERLSPSTLKRIWGYFDSDVQPRDTTLNILARFVGYRSYARFVDCTDEPQSNRVLSARLAADELEEGACVVLTWLPDRRVTVRHQGRGRFTVVKSENSKMQVGDTFTCHLMIQHEPLYLDNFIHQSDPPAGYVAGRKDGVMFSVQRR